MKLFRRIVLALVVLFVVAQFIRPLPGSVPIDPQKTLSSTGDLPANVATVFNRACRDCHSNNTTWPWYSQIAPVSWMLASHVNEGRRELNIDQWRDYTTKRQLRKLDAICKEVKEQDMPLSSYLWIHHDARLSGDDVRLLCTWAAGEKSKISRAQPHSGS